VYIIRDSIPTEEIDRSNNRYGYKNGHCFPETSLLVSASFTVRIVARSMVLE